MVGLPSRASRREPERHVDPAPWAAGVVAASRVVTSGRSPSLGHQVGRRPIERHQAPRGGSQSSSAGTTMTSCGHCGGSAPAR